MRTFAAQTTGVTTKDLIAYNNNNAIKQNKMLQGGSTTTIPQFKTGGPSVGMDPNVSIRQMAGQQLKLDAGNVYNGCVGKSAGSCGGGRRRKRKTYRRSKKSIAKKIESTKRRRRK